MVRKLIRFFPTSADPVALTERHLAGKIDLELVPQGTLAERTRAASGHPCLIHADGLWHRLGPRQTGGGLGGAAPSAGALAEGNCALVKAQVADRLGSLTRRMAARNFGPLMSMAVVATVVQASRIVAPGGIDPAEAVVTQGIFVPGAVLEESPAQEKDLNRAGVAHPGVGRHERETFAHADRLAGGARPCHWGLCQPWHRVFRDGGAVPAAGAAGDLSPRTAFRALARRCLPGKRTGF